MSSPPPPERVTPRRGAIFAAITLACVLVGGAYVAWAALRTNEPGSDAPARGSATGLRAPEDDEGPVIVFQNVARDSGYARVAVSAGAGERRLTPLICERVHVAARGGLCLVTETGLTGPKFSVTILDGKLRARHELTLSGILSRARVSPDGRYGATTGFITGHSYADGGEFSTATTLIDMGTGERIAELEDFTVMRDGRRVEAVDINFWGVTFARDDSDRFYATMRTGGRTWLIEGSVRERSARTLHENVECPSLSPDGTRVAYKKRVDDGDVIWRLHVLDLRTMRETPLAEARTVDDQAEWLDDDTVLYGLDGAIWSVAADGSGAPVRRIADGLSPAALSPPVS